MKSKFPRWGLAVLTMASVATLVLLVSGWGSAIASSVQSVIIANTASNPAQVHENGTANVNVTNTTPVPVNATNLKTDTNGNLKVAEQGTPNVNVTNTTPVPVQETNTDSNGDIKVHEQGTANINITNSTVPVTNASDGQNPFRLECGDAISSSSLGDSCGGSAAVPSGKTFVVEEESARITLPTGTVITLLTLNANGIFVYGDPTEYSSDGTTDYYVANNPSRGLYLPAGTTNSCSIDFASPLTAAGSLSCSYVGYLVNAP